MNVLRTVHFPPPIRGLLHTLSEVGFFDRSLLIGSWVMPLYQELYGVRYLLRTLDIDEEGRHHSVGNLQIIIERLAMIG